MFENIYKVGGGALITAFSFLFGGWSVVFSVFLCFMFVDVVSGFLKGIYLKNLHSPVAWNGLVVKKAGMLLAIIVAHGVDKVVAETGMVDLVSILPIEGLEGTAKFALLFSFIIMEFISINENLGTFTPLPKWYRSLFKNFNQNENGEKK